MIYNFIKNLFENKKLSESTNKKENSITFFIDDDDKIKIRIFIDDTSSKSSEHFGFLLYLINEGYYIQSILDTLFEMSQSYPDYSFFISKVIEEWSKKIKNDTEYKNEENKPIIGPSQFYNHLGK